jgi:hypothetical protein
VHLATVLRDLGEGAPRALQVRHFHDGRLLRIDFSSQSSGYEEEDCAWSRKG